MNRVIDRDSGQLRHFAERLAQFEQDLGSIADHTAALCGDASGMMQDDSGQEALRLLTSVVEDLRAEATVALRLSENLIRSAQLMEDSETLLSECGGPMAVIYAEFDTLDAFQRQLESTLSPLSAQASSQEDLIQQTVRRIEDGIDAADRRVDAAQTELSRAEDADRRAQEALRSAEEDTALRNRNLTQDKEPHEVPAYYYDLARDAADQLCQAEASYDYARNRAECARAARDDFSSYVDGYRRRQEAAVEDYRALVKKSRDFFDAYIRTLTAAKEAVEGRRSLEDDGGLSAESVEINTRALSDQETIQLSRKTGWSLKTIQQKCTVSPKGTIHFRTSNCQYEGAMHPSGVFFERSRVEINGVEVEGVFPRFEAFFEPPLMPKSLQTEAGAKYQKQFDYCNEALKKAVAADPALAAQFSPVQLQWIQLGETPPGFTWHHHQEPGRMQLVRQQEHNPQMHGAGHTGGNKLWCCENTGGI